MTPVPVLAEAATAEFLSALELSPPCKGPGNMSFRWLRRGPIKFYLSSPGLCEATIPFAPSVFNGNGQEARKSVVFSIDDATRQAMEAIEERVREVAEVSPAIWNASTKPGDKYPSSLRMKINVAGEAPAIVLDAKQERTSLPDPWRRVKANALVAIKGMYQQARGAGLLLECSAIQLGPEEAEGGAQEEPAALFAPVASVG